MGYTTDFWGAFKLSRPATEKEKEYINRFCSTRRMKRDVAKLMEIYKGEFGYPFPKEQTPEAIYGREGEYFANKNAEDYENPTIIDYNTPPGQDHTYEGDFNARWNERQRRITMGDCAPGLWCQWIINDDDMLEWDGGEKFYEYTAWLKYLITHFFEPWGIKLNGEVEWQGEDSNDFGKLIVVNNIVMEKIGRKVFD